MKNAQRLTRYIKSLPDFQIQETIPTGYDHMGAILVDAALQAGIRYDTVVWPRVEALLNAYPGAKTTTEFQRILMIEGALNLLDWSLDRKINTLIDVTRFFVAEKIETISDLRAWLLQAENIGRLREINGIGPKTADYFKILAGISTSAVDVHLYNFLAQAGVEVKGYDEAQAIIRAAAELLNIDERALDYSIWSYMST